MMSLRQLFNTGKSGREQNRKLTRNTARRDAAATFDEAKEHLARQNIFLDSRQKQVEERASSQPAFIDSARVADRLSFRKFANSKNWHLHLDITSLLLAHKLAFSKN
jgi:hypothetical protein